MGTLPNCLRFPSVFLSFPVLCCIESWITPNHKSQQVGGWMEREVPLSVLLFLVWALRVTESDNFNVSHKNSVLVWEAILVGLLHLPFWCQELRPWAWIMSHSFACSSPEGWLPSGHPSLWFWPLLYALLFKTLQPVTWDESSLLEIPHLVLVSWVHSDIHTS